MKCGYCQKEDKKIVKKHRIYELEWDDEGYPYFFEFEIGLCENHQKNLDDFTNRQKWMNLIQLLAIGILALTSISLIFLKNYFGFGVVLFLLIGLLWYRLRPNQRRLRTEQDCVAYGYQEIMSNFLQEGKEETLYFSKAEKERIFRI